jgi:hypothetical protein
MAGFIRVDDAGTGFVDTATGKPWTPYGCNYFDPIGADWPFMNWKNFHAQRFDAHFGQMADAGLNCFRIFLDTGKLNPEPGVYSDHGFDMVEQVVRMAERRGLRIIFSGPNWIEGMPQHRRGDVYASDEQLDMLCELWVKIMDRWGHDPTVFAWDLYNEPHIGWYEDPKRASPERIVKWRQRVAEEGLDLEVTDAVVPAGGASAGVDRNVYRSYVRFIEELGENWTARQCQAIRSAGAKNLITVGLVQWSTPILGSTTYAGICPRRVAKHVDYMSQHFYPIVQSLKAGIDPEIPQQQGYLEVVTRAARAEGKPLVMEEFGWKGGRQLPGEIRAYPEEHQTMWCEHFMRATARCGARGWLNWAFADSPAPNADISGASGLWTGDAKRLKHWGNSFLELQEPMTTHPPAYEPPKKVHEIDLADYLYENKGRPSHAWLNEQFGEGYKFGVAVEFIKP